TRARRPDARCRGSETPGTSGPLAQIHVPSDETAGTMTDKRTQLISIHSCWVFFVLFVLGWGVLAGFLPPPAPHDTALQVARQFRGNTTGIRVGMVIAIFSGAF